MRVPIVIYTAEFWGAFARFYLVEILAVLVAVAALGAWRQWMRLQESRVDHASMAARVRRYEADELRRDPRRNGDGHQERRVIQRQGRAHKEATRAR
jgi:hypothetical protein